MARPLQRIIQIFGLYRVADVVYSIWAGKSLLWLAIIPAVSVVISVVASGFKWASLDRYVLTFAAIYAALAIGWLATIFAFRAISPKYRFVVTSFHFNCIPAPNTIPHSNPTTANDFQAVIILQNTASFPINYIVADIDFRIQNTLASANYTNRGAVIDAGQPANFTTGIVHFHQPVNLPISGELRVTIKYGKPGKEKFARPIAISVTFVIDATTTSGLRYIWADL
jgi:hypothetical protein